jgi:hypothetical protein
VLWLRREPWRVRDAPRPGEARAHQPPSSGPPPASSRGGTDQSRELARATRAAASSLRSSSGSTDRAVAGSTPLVVAGRAVE